MARKGAKKVECLDGWRVVPYYEGFLAHKDGEVINKDNRKILQGSIRGKHIRINVKSKYNTNKESHVDKHRLVALAWVERPEHLKDVDFRYLVVHHDNKNPLDNRAENLVWMTPEEHKLAHLEDVIDANKKLRNRTDCSAPVSRYSLNGDYEKTYGSLRDAARDVGSSPGNILKVCQGERNVCMGKQWRKERYDKIAPVIIKTKQPKGKAGTMIEMCDIDWNHITYFNSVNQATRETGIAQEPIFLALSGAQKTAGGYRFRYKDAV